MSTKPRGRPPKPCNEISPTSKRCHDRKDHPYPPYRCACQEKQRPTRWVTNPLAVKPTRPRGRPRKPLNWSQNGLPVQIAKVMKDAERKQRKQAREQEKTWIEKASVQRKEDLKRIVNTKEFSKWLNKYPKVRTEMDRLMRSKPTTTAALNRMMPRFEKVKSTLLNKRNQWVLEKKSKKTRRADPSIKSSLGTYWRISTTKRLRKPRV